MITVTDSAKSQAARLMEDEGQVGYFIRVGVDGGGCSGLMYQLKFDNEDLEGDKAFEDNGVKVVVDKKSYLYLRRREDSYRDQSYLCHRCRGHSYRDQSCLCQSCHGQTCLCRKSQQES